MATMQSIMLLLALILPIYHTFTHHNSLIIQVSIKLIIEEWTLCENGTDGNDLGLQSVADNILASPSKVMWLWILNSGKYSCPKERQTVVQ